MLSFHLSHSENFQATKFVIHSIEISTLEYSKNLKMRLLYYSPDRCRYVLHSLAAILTLLRFILLRPISLQNYLSIFLNGDFAVMVVSLG